MSQRLGAPPAPENIVTTVPEHKPDKKMEEKKPIEPSRPTKTKAVKVQKESPKGSEMKNTPENPKTDSDSKVSAPPDQVQTRSQRKVDPVSPVNTTPKSVPKKSPRGSKTAPSTDIPALTRSGALKLSAKRSQSAVLPRSAAKKAQELLETPAKRTRTK
ncbi:hypothetical protein WMY93_007245 [Mugilogobius chulae]|uniref:Uncharacterized protein n=1 Tax=Mugilogobius chulae TaxID=88201 RepID=A0AAW0PN04_9GOBI